MDYKNIEINGREYQAIPIKGRRALMLDRKVMSLVTGLFGRKMDRNEMGRRICQIFGEMNDFEFENIVVETLTGVTRLGTDSEAAITFDASNVWDAFAGKIDEMYTLVIAVWEAYGLSPFAMTARGSSTGETRS